MRYLTLDDCRRAVFSYIYRNLSVEEPAPAYELENEGMAELDKVLELVQTSYYPALHDKAAYIVSSLAGSQYFSNGNKRLAVITLLAFLLLNDTEVKRRSTNEYQELLKEYFPLHDWEHNKVIQDSHAVFLYNLAIVIGDRNKWGGLSFSALWRTIAQMFGDIYRFPNL